MIYLIHGPDRFLARQSALAIAAELDAKGDNTTWLDGRETAVAEIITKIGSASLFGAPRVVIVSDLLLRSGRDSDKSDSEDADEDRHKHGVESLQPLVAAVPEEHRLILFEPSLSAAPAALKSAAPSAKVISSEAPRGAALAEWIVDRAKRAGALTDRRTAILLAETLYPQSWNRKSNNPRYDLPPDMALLTQEIEKLAIAASPGPITSEHIRALVVAGADQRLFQFVDACLSGNVRAAYSELERLAAAGEEPAMLLAQVLGQVELVTVALAAGARESSEMARDLGAVTPGRMSVVLAATRKQRPRIAPAAQIAVAADRALKTGRVRQPLDALHNLVLELAVNEQTRQTGRSR